MDAKEGSVELDCNWVVRSCSSESRVHVADNVLREELYLIWQTENPTEEAWLILEASRPVAVKKIELVNAGSSLVEVFGLREDREGEDENEYDMLLPAQQIMTVRDLVNKSNRNRAFVYDTTNKLASLACQHRWRLIRVNCKQPFGTDEHKACIGLSRLHILNCRTKEEIAAEAADALSQQHMKTELAEMFPDTIRLGVQNVSQVTDPKRLHGTQSEFKKEDEFDRSGTNPAGFATSPEKKRRLPMWGSSTEKRKMNEASEVKGSCSQERVQAKNSLDSVASMPSFLDRNGNRIQPEVNEGVQASVHDRGKARSKESKHLKTNNRVTKLEGQHSLSNLLSPEPDNKSKCNSSKIAAGVRSDKVHIEEIQQGELLFDKNAEKKRDNDAPEQGYLFHSRTGSQQNKGENVGNELHMDLKSKSSYKRGEPSTKSSIIFETDKHEFQQAGKMKTARPFSKLLEGVIFTISGLVNPERADLRDKAVEMGAQYRPDWSSACTLLICAFANTPKFKQVQRQNGTIVSKDWIPECYQKRELVEIEPYLLYAGKPWKNVGLLNSSDFKDDTSEEEDAYIQTKLTSTRLHQVGKDQVQDHNRTLASMLDVKKWAQEDLSDSIKWLQQQEQQPDVKEIEAIATQGILLCLDDAINCLKGRKSMKNILETWDFVPRAVKELLDNEEQQAAMRKVSREDILHEAERLKWIYEDEYRILKEGGNQNSSFAKRNGKQLMEDTTRDADDDNGNNDDDDDDATELMSDDGSRDAVNWESDETEVMDEDSIRQAWQSMSSHIRH